MNKLSWNYVVAAFAAGLLISLTADIQAADWIYARGPSFDGTSVETGLPDKWDPKALEPVIRSAGHEGGLRPGGEGSNVKWKREDLGGRSTPIVMKGKLYLLTRAEPETVREGERVVCIDAETGKTIWENRFNVWLSDVPDTRVGWSSVVGDPETGNVYAQGVCGYFQCIDGATGKTKWSVRMHEQFGLLSTYGGRTNFPIICDDTVIVSAIVIGWGAKAKPSHQLIGYDKVTGEVRWFNGTRPLPYDTTYSPPVLTTLKGQKALVFGSGDGAVWAFKPRTGERIWQYKFSKRGLNVSPLVVGDTVVMGHSEENIDSTAMGSLVAINALGAGDVTKTNELWKVDEVMSGKSAPLVIGERIYSFDDRAKLHIFDLKKGERITSRRGIALGTVMRSSPLYADGKIYVLTANGRWYILQPDANRGVKTLAKGRLPRGEESHGSPICANGKIYIPTTGGLYCLQDTTKTAGAGAAPAERMESPLADDGKPAHVQVVPAEALIRPGEKLTYKVRLYNSHGQFLKESAAEFSAEGAGETTKEGVFTGGGKGHQAAYVTAKVGELTGRARVRVVPDLPWTFDFEGLDDPPITWVGARYRHVIREIDGNKVMVKITTIPKGTRSRCWFGHPELKNYTITADVMGALRNDKQPDIGLIAQGYALDLQGESKALQIRSWVPQLRMAKTVAFPWKPNVWYTMKFRAAVERREVDGKMQDVAVLRGKVWPRDQDEPAEWQVEAIDTAPNRQGSPGLFGNAKDAELHLDNIRVESNG